MADLTLQAKVVLIPDLSQLNNLNIKPKGSNGNNQGNTGTNKTTINDPIYKLNQNLNKLSSDLPKSLNNSFSKIFKSIDPTGTAGHLQKIITEGLKRIFEGMLSEVGRNLSKQILNNSIKTNPPPVTTTPSGSSKATSYSVWKPFGGKDISDRNKRLERLRATTKSYIDIAKDLKSNMEDMNDLPRPFTKEQQKVYDKNTRTQQRIGKRIPDSRRFFRDPSSRLQFGKGTTALGIREGVKNIGGSVGGKLGQGIIKLAPVISRLLTTVSGVVSIAATAVVVFGALVVGIKKLAEILAISGPVSVALAKYDQAMTMLKIEIGNELGPAIQFFYQSLTYFMRELFNPAGALIQLIKYIIYIVGALLYLLGGLVQVINNIQIVLNAAIEAVLSIVETTAKIIYATVVGIINGFIPLVDLIVRTIVGLLTFINDELITLWKFIWQSFMSFSKLLLDLATGKTTTFGDDMTKNITDALNSSFDNIGKDIIPDKEQMKDIDALNAISGSLDDILNSGLSDLVSIEQNMLKQLEKANQLAEKDFEAGKIIANLDLAIKREDAENRKKGKSGTNVVYPAKGHIKQYQVSPNFGTPIKPH